MEKFIFDSGRQRPYLTVSTSDRTALDTICTMRQAAYDGADAFMIHLEKLDKQYFNEKDLREVFSFAGSRPIATLNYSDNRSEKVDEELAEGQLTAIAAGSGCCDIMADMFDPRPEQMTRDPKAVKRQAELIQTIHSLGAQVLMSTHLWNFTEPERVVEQLQEMEARGADIVKVAMRVEKPEQMRDAVNLTMELKENLQVPFLHICAGKYGKAHRILSPLLGSCMVLCVEKYTPRSNKDKPLLKAVHSIYDALDWMPCRYEWNKEIASP